MNPQPHTARSLVLGKSEVKRSTPFGAWSEAEGAAILGVQLQIRPGPRCGGGREAGIVGGGTLRQVPPPAFLGSVCPPSGSRRPSAEDALVANAAREPVGVEAFEQELRLLAAGPDQVAKARERDPSRRFALLDKDVPCACVRVGRDRVPVAEAHDPALAFEVGSERGVVDLEREESGLVELALQPLGCGRAGAERRDGPGQVELRAAPFEVEPGHDRGRPRLGRRRDAGVELVGALDLDAKAGLEILEPPAREEPAAHALDVLGVVADEVADSRELDGLVDGGGGVAALDQLASLRRRPARGRGVEDDAAAERRSVAEDDAVPAGGDRRGREPKLGVASAATDEPRVVLGGSVVDVDPRAVRDLLELLERDLEAVARGEGIRPNERIASAGLSPFDAGEGDSDALT